ncbi:MAG: 30S ribosomal protein S8 [Candidatus Saccharimonadales bacterium]
MVDPIADMLARIRNATAVRQRVITMPHSSLKEELLKTLKNEGYITDFKVNKGDFKELEVTLFKEDENSPITKIQRVSKPGLRVYVAHTEIPKVLGGRGIVVLSTSKGLMNGQTARKQKLGGEILCKVW